MDLDIIVFDCDGVILDSVDIKTRAFASLFEEHGPDAVKFMVDYHLAHGGVSRYLKFEHFYRERLGREITPQESALLDERFTRACLTALLTTPLIPGSGEFIKSRHADIPLYVASGAPHGELNHILDHMGLAGYFRGIFGSPPAKSELLADIVRRSGAEPKKTLMIGDSRTDLDAALAVGTRFLGVGEFPAPHDWLPDLTGLDAYLANNL